LRRVQDRIANACLRARRDPREVTLVAVTKSVGIDVIRQLLDLGVRDLGESHVQELTRRAAMIREHQARLRDVPAAGAPPRWHMVGHLQRNKVKALLPWVELIHSVDTLRLAEEIDRQARMMDRTVDVLLEVNASGEAQKYGLAVAAVGHFAEQIVSLSGLRLCGLMAMAPAEAPRDRLEWLFGRMAEIFTDLSGERFIGPHFRHLSMGMSSDFEAAVEQGATLVRIGTALFEGLGES